MFCFFLHLTQVKGSNLHSTNERQDKETITDWSVPTKRCSFTNQKAQPHD